MFSIFSDSTAGQAEMINRFLGDSDSHNANIIRNNFTKNNPGYGVSSNGQLVPISQDVSNTDGANSSASVPSDWENYWLDKIFTGNIEEAQKQRDWADKTNAETRDFNAQQSQIQRDWQAGQNQLIMDFNADQAAQTRAWQEAMRNTQFQATVKDLKAAGLNPVLAVGAQAMTPSATSASASSGQGSSASAGAVGGSAATVGGSYGYHNRNSAAAVVSSVGSVVNSIGNLLKGISSFIPTSIIRGK